jgi:threonine synthase
VCVLTGHGLKDPKRAMEICRPFLELPADTDAIAREMKLI